MKNKKRQRKKAAVVKRTLPCIHYTENYIINPTHPVTINLIGVGGTGSQVLNSLARMNSALKALGHPGLFVRAIDPDRVTEANMGRQLFSPSDVGAYKCTVLVDRVNRFFGTDWESLTSFYNSKKEIISANITISCVDSGSARKEIKAALELAAMQIVDEGTYYTRRGMQPYEVPYYWMDFGNTRDRGQMVVGTIREVRQPKDEHHRTVSKLSTIDCVHPDIFIDDKSEDQGPSCSLAEALHKQDLFINTNLANMGLGVLWKMFREAHIKYHGLYLNLQTMSTNPIKIK